MRRERTVDTAIALFAFVTSVAVLYLHGFGTPGMRERAALLGGRLEARAEDGVFRVRAVLPHGAAQP